MDIEASSWYFQWICAVLVGRCFLPVSGNFAIEDLLPMVIHWQLLSINVHIHVTV